MAKRSCPVDQRTLDWLLEPENPSVRYFTLRDLLGRSGKDPDVRTTASSIMKTSLVREILSLQTSGGHWGVAERFYRSKYKGTVWQLLVLAELGANGKDLRIRKACEFILLYSQHQESGGFSITGGRSGGQASGVIPCLTGNMLWVLIRFGFLKDPRVQAAIEWVTTCQRFDDGDNEAPKGWPYDRWEICWGRHTCHMGVVKVLKAFAEIPKASRSPAVRDTIEQAAEFLLLHHIYKRSHNPNRVSKPGWLKFGFPLMYQTDVLEILNLLLKLGYRDPRMEEAIELLRSKRGMDGLWRLENTYNDRLLLPIEEKGAPSKWITLNALKALNRAD